MGHPLRQIVALGGGGFSMEPDHLALDRYILSLTKSEKPKVCFVPTASGDSENYIERFQIAFRDQLGCETSVCPLFRPKRLDLVEFMSEQDVIYVGGGNTRNLITLWREWGLDHAIWSAYQKGTILAGVSAGANCWFEQFSTDSMGELSSWPGLAFLKGSFCPHYDGEEKRRPSLKQMLLSGEISSGFACDDGAAVHFVDEEPFHFISSRSNANVYRIACMDNQFMETKQPIRSLS